MRPRCGGKCGTHLSHSTPWIVANHKNEAVFFTQWLDGAHWRFSDDN
jgi:hypothetical protein